MTEPKRYRDCVTDWLEWREVRTEGHKCHCRACWKQRDVEPCCGKLAEDDADRSKQRSYTVKDGNLGPPRAPGGVIVGRARCKRCNYWHAIPVYDDWTILVKLHLAEGWSRECKNLYAPRECKAGRAKP